MSDLESKTTVPDEDPIITRKRGGDTPAEWADEAVTTILEGGDSDLSFAGTALEHTVTWSKGGRTYTSVVRSNGSQSDLDAAVVVFKASITSHGGTIISG